MSYRLLAFFIAGSLVMLAYNLARDVIGPGAWRS